MKEIQQFSCTKDFTLASILLLLIHVPTQSHFLSRQLFISFVWASSTVMSYFFKLYSTLSTLQFEEQAQLWALTGMLCIAYKIL